MDSRPGKAGSSSRVTTMMAPQPPPTPSTEHFLSSPATDISSQASVPPSSGPRDCVGISTDLVVDPHVSPQFPPKVLHRLRAECGCATDGLDHLEEMLKVKGDLPSGFVQAWTPLKPLWESCGIYFDSRDPDVQASSFAAWTDLRSLLTSSNLLRSPASRKCHIFFQPFSKSHIYFSCDGHWS